MVLVELDGLTGKVACEHTPCKHGDLTESQTNKSALYIARHGEHASHPKAEEAKTDRSLRLSGRPASPTCQWTQKRGYTAPEEEHPRLAFDLYMHAHTCMCTKYLYVPVHTCHTHINGWN